MYSKNAEPDLELIRQMEKFMRISEPIIISKNPSKTNKISQDFIEHYANEKKVPIEKINCSEQTTIDDLKKVPYELATKNSDKVEDLSSYGFFARGVKLANKGNQVILILDRLNYLKPQVQIIVKHFLDGVKNNFMLESLMGQQISLNSNAKILFVGIIDNEKENSPKLHIGINSRCSFP